MTDLLQYLDIIKQKDVHDTTLQPKMEVVKAYLVDVQNLGTPFVSSRPGFVWVREYGANGGVFQAFLSPKVQARVDLPVLVMHSPVKPFLRQVIDVDWSEMINYEDFGDQPLLGLHAPDHEWPDYTPGADPVNVYLRALVPLKTFPNTGLTVNVAPFVYEVDNEIREYFGETAFDVSEFQPSSGEAVRVLVYFDVESNSVQAVAGDPVADVPTVTPPAPVVPENAYQSALLRLDGDQATFAELDIKDIRSLYDISSTATLRGATLEDVAVAVGNVEYLLADHIVNHPGGGGTPGGSDTQVQFNDGGVFGGDVGLVFDKTTGLLTIGGSLSVNNSSDIDPVVTTYSSEISTQYFVFAKQSFNAKNDADEDVEYVRFQHVITDDADGAEGASFAIYRRVNGVMASVFLMSDTTNEIAGNTYITGNLYAGSSGDLASITNTGIVFNSGEAAVDFRIAGSGVTNGVFYDGGNNTVGINTGTPDAAYKLHVVSAGANSLFERSSSTNAAINVLYNPNTTDGNNAILGFSSDTTNTGATAGKSGGQIRLYFDTHNDATYATRFEFWTRQNGFGNKLTISNSVICEGTIGAFMPNVLITTQRNALTAVNGMLIYNSTTGKFQGYAGGAWVDLH